VPCIYKLTDRMLFCYTFCLTQVFSRQLTNNTQGFVDAERQFTNRIRRLDTVGDWSCMGPSCNSSRGPSIKIIFGVWIPILGPLWIDIAAVSPFPSSTGLSRFKIIINTVTVNRLATQSAFPFVFHWLDKMLMRRQRTMKSTVAVSE